MADDPSPPPPDPAPPAPSQPERHWHKGHRPGRRPDQDAPEGKGKRIFILLAFMVVLIGTIVGLFMLLRPFHQPFFLSVAVSQDKNDQWPVSSFARQDSDALLVHFPEASSAARGGLSLESNELTKELKELAKKEAPNGIVIHVCSLAVSDVFGDKPGKPEVLLLPADADVNTPSLRVPLSELFNAIKSCQADSKFLILDIMRPSTDARLGVVVNDVAELAAQQAQEAVKADPRLIVLLSCSPGQTALVSEDMGQSVLGYYLEEGLSGAAGSRAESGRVSARGLARFVQARVDRWAQANRGVRQTPVLVGEGKDFILANVQKPREAIDVDATEEGPPPITRAEYPKPLADGWSVRDRFRDVEKAYGFAPRALQEMEAALLRAEQRWRGGAPDQEVALYLKNRLELFEREMREAQAAIPRPASFQSLALRERAERQANQEQKARETSKPESPEPAGKKPGAEAEKPPPKEPLSRLLKSKLDLLESKESLKEPDASIDARCAEITAKEPPPYAELVRTALAVGANDINLTPLKVRFIARLCRSPEARRGESDRLAECVFLRRLDGVLGLEGTTFKDPQNSKETVQALRLMLRLFIEQEKLSLADGRVVPWVAALATHADDLRRKAEELFFGPAIELPSKLREAIEQLAAAEKAYVEANAAAEELENAYAWLDQVLHFLPSYALYLDARHEPVSPYEDAWNAAVGQAAALYDVLISGSAGLNDSERIRRRALVKQRTDELSGLMERLKRPFAPAEFLREQSVSELEALLACPWPKASERQQLRAHCRRQAQAKHKETRNKDTSENQSPGPAAAPAAFNAADAVAQERQRGDRRVRLSVTLLRLGGLETQADQLTQLLASSRSKPTAEALRPVAARLRLAWSDDVPRRLDELPGDLAAADRLGRVLHRIDLSPSRARKSWIDPTTRQPRDPAGQMRIADAVQRWRFLGERYDREAQAKLPDDAPFYRNFYKDAGREYLRVNSSP